MMPYIKIRDALAIALAAQIGTYTFSNGVVVAALAIETGSNRPVEKAARRGLEVIIDPDIRLPVEAAYAGLVQEVVGMVTLLQWDAAQGVMGAAEILLDMLQADFPELSILNVKHKRSSEKVDERLESFSVEFSQTFLIG